VVCERFYADFRTFRVHKYGYRNAQFRADAAHEFDTAQVFGVVAVRHVQPSDVQPRFHEAFQRFVVVCRRTQGADYFGFSHKFLFSYYKALESSVDFVDIVRRCLIYAVIQPVGDEQRFVRAPP